MDTTIQEIRKDRKQMNTAQLCSSHLNRKAKEYKIEGNEKQMKTKSKEMRRDIKQMQTAQLSPAHLTRKK